MSCQILYDNQRDIAALYCSTSDVAFGPVFCEGDDSRGADERAEAFLRWLESADVTVRWAFYEPNTLVERGRRDPRVLSEAGLQYAYSDWLAQEQAQYAREDAAQMVE